MEYELVVRASGGTVEVVSSQNVPDGEWSVVMHEDEGRSNLSVTAKDTNGNILLIASASGKIGA